MSFIKYLVLSMLAVLAPIKAMLIAAIVVIIVDLITGILAARKQGQSITSARLRDTVTKLCIFQVAIIMGFIIETYLLGGLLPVSKLVAGVIGTVEGTSILENLNIISGTDIFKSVIDKLGSKNKTDI